MMSEIDQEDTQNNSPKKRSLEHSYSKFTDVECPHCHQSVRVNVWWIVDQSTQPDLIQKIVEGSFKTHPCPKCTQLIPEVDQPLLIYRPRQQQPLLFAPALKTTLAEDQTHTLQHLVQHLLETLDSSDDDWIMEGLKRIRWNQLLMIYSEAELSFE
ncbi:hypothetical protein AM1_A0083 (plasmid) [Acaryochloris marina MBIC11017]|uniref:CpXC domain-containing protein n=1 Tax=Acaryochloris marina (strain MBIC 11017) TaxID=329726 RepID=A8ZK92_ACAM1|nr:hypothetical protein AM1_A0083 [Acaryochloris marina MBIC11017]